MRFQNIKKTGALIIVAGLGFLGYEVHKTFTILNSALDTSVIDLLEPRPKQALANKKYLVIYLPDKSPSVIDRFWSTLTFSYAKRLLNIAQSDGHEIRKRAVESLSQLRTLDEWHYSLLAHMIDRDTAVGLARSKDVDLNYFIKPPKRYVYYNHDKIVSWMKHFLISLSNDSNHPCIDYFIDKAFMNVQDIGRMVEHDISSAELKQCIQSADDILPLCIESILHHSTIKDFAKDIVQNNGLPLLMEIHKRYRDNLEISINLVTILANISAYPEFINEIFRSGWVGVLAKFLKHKDIRIAGPAAKALANLDIDDHLEGKFDHNIYLLHPVHRTKSSRDVDVVFVHGLLGGVFFTWRQRDRTNIPIGFLGKNNKTTDETITCTAQSTEPCMIKTSDTNTKELLEYGQERNQLEWCEIGKDFEIVFSDCPKDCNGIGPFSCPGEEISCLDDSGWTQCWPMEWLPNDCRNIRILGLNYDTNLSFWAPMCPINKQRSTLDERSEEFMQKLITAGVGQKPIVWMTHSMGGLLVKNMLVKASKSCDSRMKNICKNTKGIVFFSTPHKGSHVATINQTASLFIWPSMEVQELREGSPKLLKLHNDFLELLQENKPKILSFIETECTTITPLKLQFHFVPPCTATLNYGEVYEMCLDHLRICKPLNRHSFIYRKIVLFLKDIINETEDLMNLG